MNHTVFFLGMALLQVIFVTYQFILFKRKEFLFYLLYGFCVSIFVCFKVFPEYNPFPILVDEEQRFTAGRSVMLIGYAMYFSFGRHFTETPQRYPRLNQQVKLMEWIFLGFGLTDIFLLFNGVDFYVLEPVSITIYLLAMPVSLYVILYLLTRKRKLTSILVIGSGLLLLFASAGFIDSNFISGNSRSEVDYIVYMELGIFCEFLFLNYGLIYKTRMIQKENMKMEVDKQVELYRQRMRISNDLHDEVGATLSGLAMYSQITKEQIKSHDTGKVEHSLNIMQESAAQMVDKLNEIVWTVNPEQDQMDMLLQKLEEYAQEMGAVKHIKVHASIAEGLKEVKLLMEERRHMYLLCKEAINNAVKYSHCTDLSLHADCSREWIRITVEDNGTGFDPLTVKRGNGIGNMMRRAQDIGTELQIDSKPGKGTRITVEKKIPQ
jgi:signal transduction histidine kinase